MELEKNFSDEAERRKSRVYGTPGRAGGGAGGAWPGSALKDPPQGKREARAPTAVLEAPVCLL